MRMRVLGFAIVASVVAALLVPGAAVADPPATNFGATLTGDQVVPGPGAPDGFANAAGTLFPKRPSLVCGGFGNIQGAERPFTAELHQGPAGETGPVVATFQFGEFGSECDEIDKKVLRDIVDNLEGYYLDIHTDEFPDGAMRGQLLPR